MKLFIVTVILMLSPVLCFGQIKHMGFTTELKTPERDYHMSVYYPKLKLIGDTLFAPTNSGIYCINLKQNTDWKCYAFEGFTIVEFLKTGDKLLASSTGTRDSKDSLLFCSSDNGKTFINYTSSLLLEYERDYLPRIVQNPENANSILSLGVYSGTSKSSDFGFTWENINDYGFDYQSWYLGFHPLDTMTLFSAGEIGIFQGTIYRSSDNGSTWSTYRHPGGDNCIHHITFHPTDPNILVYSGEMTMGKSTDKGNTWVTVNLYDSGMYFYKVLFDEENPNILYASGNNRSDKGNNKIYVYRSVDMGDSWHLAYEEELNMDCEGVIDMVKFENKLIFYTIKSGLFELDLETTPVVSTPTINVQPELTVFPNPAQNILHFETDQNIEYVKIIDLSGRILQDTKIHNNDRQIDVSLLNSGYYFATFHTKNQNITKKICIIK